MEPHETESGHVLPVAPRSGEGLRLGGGGGEGGRRHRDGDPKHRTSRVWGMGKARSPRVRFLPLTAQNSFFRGFIYVCVCVLDE